MKSRGPHPVRKGGSSSLRVLSRNSGFTLVELMVVGTIMVLALAVSLPLGTKWLDDHRYSATCRAFYNAIHLAKINAISGSAMFNVTTIDMGGDVHDFVVTTEPFMFRCDHTPDINTKGDYPVSQGTAVALAGFIDPVYVNGNVLEVKTTPTVVNVTDLGDGLWEAELRLTLHSDRLQWSPAPGAAITANTGKAWTVAAAKFVPITVTENVPVYSVKKTQGTVECEYNPSLYHIEVNGNDAEATTVPIVFDSKGCPKDLVPYTILVRRKKDGAASTQHPPFTITVQASGKIFSGG